MSNYFEEEVFRRLDRMENKMDELGEKVNDVDKRMAVADAKHGFIGGAAGVVTAALAYFLSPRH